MAKFLLQKMLDKRKMTRYRFAQGMGQEYQTVRRLFRPGYDPKLSVLARCARVLKCKIRDLVKE